VSRAGSRPCAPQRHDRATSLWPLALVSFGESWHNTHHSGPARARHGTERGQAAISAAVLRAFKRLGWATGVHWPAPARLAAEPCSPASSKWDLSWRRASPGLHGRHGRGWRLLV
jgi:fatty-acid desaturase